MANNGGKIAPDGRPPVAPGVGKTARRHDLEAPATPGLGDSDLQQGDVSRLENSQRIAPIGKRTQPAARGGATKTPQRRRQSQPVDSPDPISFAGGKFGGQPIENAGQSRVVDTSAWLPLLKQMALTPNSGGALSANLMNMLTAYRKRPMVSETVFLDMQELDKIVDESI